MLKILKQNVFRGKIQKEGYRYSILDLTRTQKTFILCCLFIVGLASVFLGYSIVIASFIAVLGLYLSSKNRISKNFFICCLLITAFAITYTNLRSPKPDMLYQSATSYLTFKGRVISKPVVSNIKTKFEFKISEIKTENKWIKNSSKTLLNIYGVNKNFNRIEIGDVLQVHAKVKKPYEVRNPGQFDYGKYLKNKRIFTISYASRKKYKILEKPDAGMWWFLQSINRIREKVLEKHAKYLESPYLETLGGIVFGDNAVPPPSEVKESFIKSGLFHLLAASGLNVGLIFGIWYFIVQRLGASFAFSIISGGLLVFIYSFMTGLPPSILRAAGMLELALIGKLIDRESDNLTLLAFVAVVILLFDPLMINEVGFQMSFIVTLGLLLCVSPVISKIPKIPVVISGAIIIPLIAQCWVAPIQAFHFNTFALYSLPANILVVPFMGIISFSGFIGSILSFIPTIGDKFCLVADFIAKPFLALLLTVSDFFASLPDSLINLAKPHLFTILMFYLFLLVLFFAFKLNFKNKKNNITLGVIALMLLCQIGFSDVNKDLSFVFFDVGEGDSILIRTPSKKHILVDTGRGHKYGYSIAKMAIVPYLKDLGAKKIDLLVLTHPDSDHMGATVNLAENIKIEKIIHNGGINDSKTYRQMIKYIKKNKLNYELFKNNDYINIDKNLQIRAFQDKDLDKSHNNDNSIIMHIKYKDFSALLTADNEIETYKLLKKNIKQDIDLLKVGHHGSRNCLDKKMLNFLKPKIAVISVGKNQYGHPHPQTTTLLKNHKIETYRTDKNKAVMIKTNGKKIDRFTFDSESGNWQKIKP